jgi:hypothetical protein
VPLASPIEQLFPLLKQESLPSRDREGNRGRRERALLEPDEARATQYPDKANFANRSSAFVFKPIAFAAATPPFPSTPTERYSGHDQNGRDHFFASLRPSPTRFNSQN